MDGATLRGHWEVGYPSCGDTVEIASTNRSYLPWKNLKEAIPRVDTDFNKRRGQVRWTIVSQSSTSSFDPATDKIRFGRTYYSAWTAAHEYVHALQHESMGGIFFADNCNPHHVDQESSYSCALQEGIADYGGNVGAPDDQKYGNWENWDDGEGDTPAKIEGYVAAMFHDLLDGGIEKGDKTNHDGTYVMTVFTTCTKTYYRISVARDNVSDFVWCLENAVTESAHNTNFPGQTVPKAVGEDAIEPTDWNKASIRSTWLLNIGR